MRPRGVPELGQREGRHQGPRMIRRRKGKGRKAVKPSPVFGKVSAEGILITLCAGQSRCVLGV